VSYRGHTVVGAIAGFLFGGFVAADLFLFGVIPMDSIVFTLAPFVGLILGIVLGRWAPLRRSRVHVSDDLPPADPGSSDPASAGVD
jgi:hypothetical protein